MNLQLSRELLKRYLKRNKISQRDACVIIGISNHTLTSFLKGLRVPHNETHEKVDSFLRKEGVMTASGQPTEPLDVPTVKDRTDERELLKMGIKQADPAPILNTIPTLTPRQKRFLTALIWNSQEDDHGFKNSVFDALGL